jgi:23S rRNA (uracil1939-C5)-methyltransferase
VVICNSGVVKGLTMSDKCPNKKVCGSCEWSEMNYKDQLLKKLNEINLCFEQNGFDFRVREIKASPKESHYRNRMDFVIDYHGNFGLREKGKWWKVIDSHTCFISNEKIEEAFHICYQWVKNCGLSYADRKTHKGLLSYIVLRYSTLKELMVNVVTSSDFDEKDEKTIEEIEEKIKQLAEAIVSQDKTLKVTVVWSINHTDSDIEEEVNGIRYVITPNAFFQTNSLSAENLQNVVLDFAKKTKADSILDLYCGSGFFTIPLSKISNSSKTEKRTLGIEIIKDAIDTARINAKNNSSLAEFRCEKSEDLSWQDIKADLVVLDPPRAGLHNKVLESLIEKKPNNIIYVSCNYLNFIKELKVFSSYYNVVDSVAVDMFPHTHHVELVTLMCLK